MRAKLLAWPQRPHKLSGMQGDANRSTSTMSVKSLNGASSASSTERLKAAHGSITCASRFCGSLASSPSKPESARPAPGAADDDAAADGERADALASHAGESTADLTRSAMISSSVALSLLSATAAAATLIAPFGRLLAT